MSAAATNRARRRAVSAAVLVGLQMLCALTGAAQTTTPNEGGSSGASRSELESRCASLQREMRGEGISKTARDSLSARAQEIARRLRDGDFLPGDRIVLHVLGEPALNDTLTVRAEQQLPFPGLADMPLHGVLRSELRERMEAHLSRFLRAPQFSVTPLIRLAVIGEVLRPGFYSIPADARVTDALMLAGGPTGNGDLRRLTLTRGGRPLVDEAQMQDIVARGLSLDLAGVVPGDEVVVGQRSRRDSQFYFQAGTVVLTALSTFAAWAAISHRH